jgi:hypothetical protein
VAARHGLPWRMPLGLGAEAVDRACLGVSTQREEMPMRMITMLESLAVLKFRV